MRRTATPRRCRFKSYPMLHNFLKDCEMAHKQQGNLTKNPQWWKHLKDWKRVWHKQERQAYKHFIKNLA